jgi:excisionase family DNA binding protein
VLSARERLGAVLASDLIAALEELVDERVEERLAEHGNGAPDRGPRWLTLTQAAERLGCSPDAIRMRAKRGRLEVRRHGARVYVSAASVDTLGQGAVG